MLLLNSPEISGFKEFRVPKTLDRHSIVLIGILAVWRTLTGIFVLGATVPWDFLFSVSLLLVM